MISPKDTSLIEEELGAFSFMLFNAAFSSKSFRTILLHCNVLLNMRSMGPSCDITCNMMQ